MLFSVPYVKVLSISFSMSADDCLMYLGNSNFQKSIGHNAVYGDGGKEVKKLLPYKL